MSKGHLQKLFIVAGNSNAVHLWGKNRRCPLSCCSFAVCTLDRSSTGSMLFGCWACTAHVTCSCLNKPVELRFSGLLRVIACPVTMHQAVSHFPKPRLSAGAQPPQEVFEAHTSVYITSLVDRCSVHVHCFCSCHSETRQLSAIRWGLGL